MPRRRRGGAWALTSLLSLAIALLVGACGGGADASHDATAEASATSTSPELAARELWNADGRARITRPEDWPADTAAHWSGRRYATRAQLDRELTTASPYTLVLEADDDAALESALRYADTVSTFAGGKALLGVFVRSRQPALAARLAERLTAEQGWAHVYVVI